MNTWDTLYKRTKEQASSIDEQIQLLLDAVSEMLSVEMGIVSRITDDDYRVLYSTNPDLVGETFSLGYTYCSITYKRDNLVAIPKMSISEWLRHPAYTKFNLETYIGLPLWVNGQRYGTLNFTRAEPRPDGFSERDRAIMEMTGQAIQAALEEKQQQAHA